MAVRPGSPAPYAPPATVLALIQSFRNRGLQTPFTPDVLARAGVQESLIPRTMQALRVLDLVDAEGAPTAQLEGLRRAAEGEYKPRLEAVIRAAYAEVFQFVDPAKDDAVKVRDAFRAFEPIGQIGRMVTLFLGLCQAAGIIPEGSKKPAQTQRKPVTPYRPATVSAKAAVRGVGGIVPPAISGLLGALPGNGKGWTQEDRDKFMRTFESVLDFSIPIRAQADEAEPAEED